ncbi:MAG: aminoacyl-tRNA hydrolase [Candidatus Latescibacter sp.]|nr:aminoacyl-tRNA hydrolase [Candidatus Latescibacter sp.]
MVGLGNPGAAYRNSRHNAGFILLDGMVEGRFGQRIVFRQSAVDSVKSFFGMHRSFKKSAGLFTRIEGEVEGKKVLLVKPNTYMNESGKALTSLRTQGLIRDISEMLVVVDDVDIEIGRLRIRSKGSAGGHNGLKSIIDSLGTDEFARLRIGVGPRPPGSDMVTYVLESFRPQECEIIEKAFEHASRCIEAWITGGIENAHAEITNVLKNLNN